MHARYLLLALPLTLLALPSALAAPAKDPFAGTWKLDMSRSHFEGETYTITKNPNGKWHFSSGTIAFDFAMDGKDYPTVADRTAAVTQTGPNTWLRIARANGKELSRTTETLSPDGKTLVSHRTGTRPDGAPIDETETWTRVSGSSGIEGKWRSTKVSDSASSMYIITDQPDGTVQWSFPDYKETVAGKPDGQDLAITGPTTPKGMTLSEKPSGVPRQRSYTIKLNGKRLEHGLETVSPDGKLLTLSEWQEGKPDSERQTAIYVRQ